LFAKPANVIVLDEPTNDLDTETLELLEELLVQFDGTVLLVSHDRAFLNNVVTSSIAFEQDGIREYVGGYDDWLRQRSTAESESAQAKQVARSAKQQVAAQQSSRAPAAGNRRLSYKEQQELLTLPATIEQLESEIGTLHHTMAQPQFYQQPGEQIAQQQSRIKLLESQLATAYQRWEELEPLAK
jgi:ATP-binding cassette subfamily F protein uup